MKTYTPTKEELLLATEKAKDHVKRWGGPPDMFSAYLTAFIHGIGYGKANASPVVEQPKDTDFEAALEAELNKLPYTKHVDDGGYNDGQLAGFEKGSDWARQYLKASQRIAEQPKNLPIEELIKLSDEQLSEEINKVRSRLGMGEQPKDTLTIADYEEVLKDHRRLVREIDVILHGDGAAKQASLCDLIGPIQKLVEKASQPVAGSHWVKGEYERLYTQVKGGKRTVCYIDNTSFNDNHPAPRDICTAKVFPEYIEFLSRGHGYATIWNDQTIETFVNICESLNVEWLDEDMKEVMHPVAGSHWVKLEDFEFQTHETVYAKWEPYPNNTWRSCCNKDHEGRIRWHGDAPRDGVQVYILDESTPSGSQREVGYRNGTQDFDHLGPEAASVINAVYEGCALWQQEYDACRRILTDLVTLKNLKDVEGKTEEYQKRQPFFWEKAKKFLEDYQHLIS